MRFIQNFLLFSILSFSVLLCYSTVEQRKADWQKLAQEAKTLHEEDKYLEAENKWNEAYTKAIHEPDSIRNIIKFHLLYTQAILKNYSFDALPILEEAHHLLDKIYLSSNELNEFYKLYYHCLGYNGNWTQALSIAQKSYSIHPLTRRVDSISYASLIHDIGFIFNKIGDYPSAIENYHTSIDFYHKIYGKYHSDVALSYNNLAYNYGLLGMSQKQLQAYLTAAGIWENIDLDDKSYLMTVYGNLLNWNHNYGNTEEMIGLLAKIKEHIDQRDASWRQKNHSSYTIQIEKDLKTTLDYWNKCLKYFKSINDESQSLSYLDSTSQYFKKYKILQTDQYFRYLISAYNDVSDMYFEKGEINTSLEWLVKGMETLKRYGYSGNLSDHHARLAKTYIALKNYPKAQEHIDTAIAQNKDYTAFPAYHIFRAQIAEATHQHHQAEKHYRQAIAYLLDNQHLSNHLQEIRSHHFNERVQINDIYTLSTNGEYFLRRYLQTDDACYLEDAQHVFLLGLEMLNSYYLGGVYTDVLSTIQNTLQSGLLASQMYLSHIQSEKIQASTLLENIENNRSHHSWKKFIKNHHLFRQSVADSLNHEEEKHKKMVLFYQQKLKNTAIDSLQNQTTTYYKARLHEHQTSLKNIEHELLELHPNYKKFSSGMLNIQQLQNQLPHNTAMLRYIVTDSMTYLFHIGRNEIKLYSIGSTDSLLHWTENAVHAIQNKEDQFYPLTQTLYRQLIAPVENKLLHKNLIIVPDRFLHQLPFEALSSTGQAQDYLIHRHHISYSTNLVLWQNQMTLPNIKNVSFAAFSPNYDHSITINKNEIVPLKGAQQESEKINFLMQGLHYGGDTLNKDFLIEKLPQYHILHLAMHTEHRKDEEINFILSDNSTMSVNDLYALRLKAQLTVLTACNTGQGTWKNGEGVQSLANSFSFAGVSSLIMSLWQLPDLITSKISINFYKNLIQGDDKHYALSQAKRNYLNEVQYEPASQHPYYWAGLVISGDTRPITNKHHWNWAWLAWAILSLTIIVVNKKYRN